MKKIQSAVLDKIEEALPKGSELLFHSDDGISIYVEYSYNNVEYKTKLVSNSRAHTLRALKKEKNA